MKKFESYLEEVKENNPDEFSELTEILSRYDTLKTSNDKLHENHKDRIEEIDTLTRKIMNEKKMMTIEKMTIYNQIAKQTQRLEEIEDKKSKILATSDEQTTKKLSKTTEHGQILMTIHNLYNKCLAKQRNMVITWKDIESTDLPKNFDDTAKSGEAALAQLSILLQWVQNFKILKEKITKESKDKSIDPAILASLQKFREELEKKRATGELLD